MTLAIWCRWLTFLALDPKRNLFFFAQIKSIYVCLKPLPNFLVNREKIECERRFERKNEGTKIERKNKWCQKFILLNDIWRHQQSVRYEEPANYFSLVEFFRCQRNLIISLVWTNHEKRKTAGPWSNADFIFIRNVIAPATCILIRHQNCVLFACNSLRLTLTSILFCVFRIARPKIEYERW